VSLSTVPFEVAASRPSPDVRRFLHAATRLAERFQFDFYLPAFVSSDFGLAYAALRQLEASKLALGERFCEWGSGLGVVTCLATLAGFHAWGIEAQVRLVRGARQLAAEFDLPAEFTCGSFIPAGARRDLLAGREFTWLSTGGRCAHGALGIGLDEFDVIYAYPWPDEECLVEQLFDGHARPGTLLMTYHEDRGLSLRRKGGRGAPGG
jgi:hypothetical protein